MNLQMLQLSAQTINGLAVYLDLTLKTSDNLFFLGVLKGQTLNGVVQLLDCHKHLVHLRLTLLLCGP